MIENIVRLILERIIVGDPPFLSEICENTLVYNGASIDLNADLNSMEQFVRGAFHISREKLAWKNIRKQNVRNYLLHKYSRSPRALLMTHLNLVNKTISNDQIHLAQDSFDIESISTHGGSS